MLAPGPGAGALALLSIATTHAAQIEVSAMV
jgi:hypothetical protein